MKILFTADWHLKLGQKNVPASWALQRYKSFFQQVHTLENEIDMHIIGGDIFDRLPSLEELSLYFDFISKVAIPTIIYDGNHEATKKNETFLSYLKSASYEINPKVEIVTDTFSFDDFTILPYKDLHTDTAFKGLDTTKPLFTHVRAEIPPHVHPEVPLEYFNDFPIVFAGDLHSHTNTQRNIVYPGSPMTITFHRQPVETGYLIIDTEDWDWEWDTFHLPQLIRKTVSRKEDMIPTKYDHTIYELEGDITDLGNVEDSDILDKKVIKRSTDTALILSKDMTIEDELAEYLLWILDLKDDKVRDILKTFSDYSKKANVG